MSEEEPKFVGTRRFGGQPVRQPAYNFRDVPYCSEDLAGSTLSEVTNRQHLVDSIAEFALLCNEAARRKHQSEMARGKKSRCPSKPLGIEYIFDRIDTDDPIWGFMVRTDTPMSSSGRTSNLKASPQWKRGMLQGFITVTTFTQWRSSFRFDSLHESAFAYDPDDLTELALKGIRKYDNDGRLAEELEATVHGGDPWNEGIVYPRIAEISLFGALGCGKKLLQLVIERLERAKASKSQNYDYIVLQATENSIPFYESMGFVRVGCIMENKTSEKGYKSSPVESYVTKKHGETLAKISQQVGCNVWDAVFLNKPMYPTIEPRSWLKKGTTVFYHSTKARILATSDASKTGQLGVTLEESSLAPKWYVAKENDTPRSIAKKFCVNFGELLECNKKRYPELVGTSRLKAGTRIQVSRFDVEDEAYIPYSHWTFPDDELEPDEPSYMMAMKLERKSGKDASSLPIAKSLSVPISPYSPDENGASEILQQPPAIKRTAPIFNPKKTNSVKKPKRPMNAFHFFSADFRSKKKEVLQGLRLGECTKIITQEWKKLSDGEQAPYLEKSKEMRMAYAKEMEEYRKEVSKLTTVGIDTSLLEQVVKLKSNVGAQSFTSKFKYWYVLTFIPDLQWVHLIPLKQVGVFGPEHPEVHGRTIWMIEDEGNELDTTAAMCTVVKSQTIANSEDADDEQWVIFDGEKPKLAPIFAAPKDPQALKEPFQPTTPPNSHALFCADPQFKTNIEELKGKKCRQHELNLFRSWDSLNKDQKRSFREQEAKLLSSHQKDMEKYRSDLAEWERLRPDTKPLLAPYAVKTIIEPHKPKKWPSSYSIFCADAKTKPHIKEELKGKSHSERIDILSKLWHSMDEDQKRPYREQEAKFQSSHEKEMKNYKANLAEWKRQISYAQHLPHQGVNQVNQEPTKPKKYPTSYTLFCADAKTKAHISCELSGKTLPECSQILSKHWKSMTEEQKLPYKEQQSKLQSLYEKEMEKYRSDLAEWRRQISCAPHLPYHGVNRVSKEPAKPKKYPTSYSLFCADAKTTPQIQNELRGKSLTERSQILSKHWESMNEEQKRPYKEQQSKLKLVYETQMKKYRSDLAEWKRRFSCIQHLHLHGKSLMVKEPTKPKNFPTSYSLSCADAITKLQIQNELKGKSLSDCVEIFSRQRESMNNEQKQPYKGKQATLQSAYEEEMEEYKADLAEWKLQTPQVQPLPNRDSTQSQSANPKLLSSVKSSPKSKISKPVDIANEISLKTTKSKSESQTANFIASTSSSHRTSVEKAKLDCMKSTKEDSKLECVSADKSRSEMQDCKQVPSKVQLAPIFLQNQKRKKSVTEESELITINPMERFHQTTLDPEIKGISDNIEFAHSESVTTIDSALPTDTITFGCSQNSDHSTACENLEVEMKKMLEYCAPSSESSQPVVVKEKIVRGDIVMVAKRTMPGINKLGGVARITKVHQSGGVLKYDVSYVLGGREKEVDECFVSLHKDEHEMKTDSHTSGRKRRSCRNGAMKDNVTMLVSDDANSAASMDSDEPSNKRRRIKS